MSALSDELAATQANLDAVNTRLDEIATGVTALDALITSLQNSPGTLNTADQAALDAIQTASAALAAKAGAVVVTPPVTTSPTP